MIRDMNSTSKLEKGVLLIELCIRRIRLPWDFPLNSPNDRGHCRTRQLGMEAERQPDHLGVLDDHLE
jgi:hypothetical protein